MNFSRQVYRQAWREHDLNWIQANHKAKWPERHQQYAEVHRIIALVQEKVPAFMQKKVMVEALTLFWKAQKLTRPVYHILRELDLAKVR